MSSRTAISALNNNNNNFHESAKTTIELLQSTQKQEEEQKTLDVNLEMLRQEADGLLRKRERIIQDNLKLWNILTAGVASDDSYSYEWARKRLDDNEFGIESIDDRLGQIKKREQEHKDDRKK